MRNGRLLAEAPPDAVMKQHNAAVSTCTHTNLTFRYDSDLSNASVCVLDFRECVLATL